MEHSEREPAETELKSACHTLSEYTSSDLYFGEYFKTLIVEVNEGSTGAFWLFS